MIPHPVLDNSQAVDPDRLLSEKWGAKVSCGGYPAHVVDHFLERFDQVWHPLLPGEEKPRGCTDEGIRGGRGNIVLIGDAARLFIPGAGTGGKFALFFLLLLHPTLSS